MNLFWKLFNAHVQVQFIRAIASLTKLLNLSYSIYLFY